jgi:wyosine [tRNA(Phe)-imidazoG37] synthetase (radical SAM superfamily)
VNAGITNMNGSKTEEIAELLKAVPVHPDKIEINTENYASGSNTSITRKYKSDAPFIECLQQCKLLAPPNQPISFALD